MSSMLDRFEGDEGVVELASELEKQWIVNGNPDAAAALAEVAQLRELAATEVLIREGAIEPTIHFILTGKVLVTRNGKAMISRAAGLHVGEIALLEPEHPRTASVIAVEPTVAATVTETDFTRVAEWFPELWRRIAIELGRRSLAALKQPASQSADN